MGRRPVRRAAPSSDGAVVGAAEISSSPSSAPSSNGIQHPVQQQASGAAAEAAKGDSGTEGENPLMGLVHYGSDSDEDEASVALPSASTSVAAPSDDVAVPSSPSSSSLTLSSLDPPSTASVAYILPTGWQQCMDNAGLVYFWNTETGVTSWDPPDGTETTGRSTTPPQTSVSAVAVDTLPSEAPTAVVVAQSMPAAGLAASPAGVAGGEGQTGSDATSDTASEAEEEQAEDSKAAAAAAAVLDGEDGKDASTAQSPALLVRVDTEQDEEGPLGDEIVGGRARADPKRSPRSAAEHPVSQERLATKGEEDGGGEEEEEEGEVRQQSEADTPSSDMPVEAAAGIDDLLAGIEAELLLGGGDGEENDNDNDKPSSGVAGDISEARAEGREEEENFSPLRLVAPGLDTRAQLAHAELTTLLAGAAVANGREVAPAVEPDPSVRLSIELAAVLASRLSDWREGGLDGTFLVVKLEEMVAKARSTLTPSSSATVATTTSRTQTRTGPSQERSELAASADAIAPGANGIAARGGSIPGLAEPAASDYAEAESAGARMAKQAGGSRKRRRAHRGVAKASPVVGGETTEADSTKSVVDDTTEGAEVNPATDVEASSSSATNSGASASASGGGGAGADSSRAEKYAERLKWADEVSAAASAAVAAAAALSKAKKDEVKEESRANAAAAEAGKKGTGSRGSKSSRRTKIGAPTDDATRDNDSHAASGAQVVAAGATVQGAIDSGRVDDDGEEEEDRESTVATAAGGGMAVGAAKDDATSMQTLDRSESGIVIAKELSPPAVPSGWAAVFDTTQQAFYYHNLATDETTWVLPPAVIEQNLGDEPSSNSPPQRDEPPLQGKGKKSKVGESDASTGTGDKGVKSRHQSQRRGSPREGRDAERLEASGGRSAKSAAEGGSGKGEVASGATSTASSRNGKPAAVASTAVASSGDDSASATETLPSAWVPIWDDNRQAFYYHNTVTDETSWEPPAAPVATAATDESLSAASSSASSKKQKKQEKREKTHAGSTTSSGAQARLSPPDVVSSPAAPPVTGLTSSSDERDRSPSPATVAVTAATSAHDSTEDVAVTAPPPASTAASAAAAASVTTPPAPSVDLRPCTLVWWSDAGDVWNGMSLSGLLGGYGPRRYRNLGGGYYMMTLESGPEWATAAVAALGQGVVDPVAAARVDWVSCTASAPGYGLFLRFSGEDDEQKLFDVPDEYFDDPPPDPAIVAAQEAAAAAAAASAAALAEAEAAAENAEIEAAAAAAVAATQEAEAAGSKVAAAVLGVPPAAAPSSKTSSKKRKIKGSSATGKSGGSSSLGKKRKGAASLIDKWKAVASTAGEEAEKETEKREKMERWKARAAAMDPDNPNFTPIGKRR